MEEYPKKPATGLPEWYSFFRPLLLQNAALFRKIRLCCCQAIQRASDTPTPHYHPISGGKRQQQGGKRRGRGSALPEEPVVVCVSCSHASDTPSHSAITPSLHVWTRYHFNSIGPMGSETLFPYLLALVAYAARSISQHFRE